jgi:hypothetical protein
MFAALVPVLAPVVAAILVGVIWGKRGKPVDPGQASQLILNVGTPCLIFSSLSTLEVAPAMLVKMALAALALLVGFLFAGAILLKLLKLRREVYLAPVVFGNLGNLALPLSLFAFGPEGLELSLIMFATQSVLFFTIGMWLMSGHPSPLMMAKTPHPYAIAVALTFTLTGTVPPVWLTNVTELLGAMTIPLMLVMLGVSLSRMHVVAVWRPLLIVALRLAIGIAIAVGLARLLALEGVAAGVLFIACCMPAAVFNYLMAVRYERDSGQVASYIVLSTLAILLLLPVLVPVAWWIAD